jgi:hypothetical protein
MGVASGVVSSRTIWCLAYLYSEYYAFRKSLVYAVTNTPRNLGSVHDLTSVLRKES